MVSVVSVAYVLVSLGIARTSFRLGAPAPAAFAVAAFALLDLGSDFTWGTRPVFFYGFLPSTISIAITLHTLPSPSISSAAEPHSFAITALGFGVATAMHPLSVVLAVTLPRGPARLDHARPLGSTARSCRPSRRPFSGCSARCGWALSSERIISYGVHYGTPQVPLELALERMVGGLLTAGSRGLICIAVYSRARSRSPAARPPRPASSSWSPPLRVLVRRHRVSSISGSRPSIPSVRWQSFRVGTFLKPMLYVLSAHGLGLGASFVSSSISRRARVTTRVLALLGVCAVWWIAEPDVSLWLEGQQAVRRLDMTGPYLANREAFADLRAHLEAERARIAADQHTRLLIYCPLDCPYELMTIAWDPGIPLLLHHPAPAGHFLLREQFFFETSPENLRRFGVRWVLAVERTPPPAATSPPSSHFGNLVDAT